MLPRPDANISDEVIRGWTNHYLGQSTIFHPRQSKTEKPIIRENGILNIRWLVDIYINSPVEFDFILATATLPTLTDGRYPSSRMIAKKWRNDKDDNVEYFSNNREHGITTFQDEQIIKDLNARDNKT